MTGPRSLRTKEFAVRSRPTTLAPRNTIGRLFLGLALGVGSTALTVLPGATPASAATCVTAGSTGLTAAEDVVANVSGGSIDATGCDVGLYVAPGNNGITISGVTVSGANDEGILAEDVSGLTVTGSTIENNTVDPNSKIPDGHALMLDGVTGATISNNTVENNDSGGIGLADYGTVDPGAPDAGPATPVPSTNDTISGNTVLGNTGGCAIIVEAWNPGGGVTGTTISGNTVTGVTGQFGPHGPVIGQIVLADDAASTTISTTTILGNTVIESFATGITLHTNAPHDVISGTAITGDILSGNNWGFANAAPSTCAIALIDGQFPGALAATISGTDISGTGVGGEAVAVWIDGATSTTIGPNNGGGFPNHWVYNVPTAGGGYWLAGSDGGVFNFGNANYVGSRDIDGSGSVLTETLPIVALAPSRDRGGYWEVGADGGVIGFGDAYYYGSIPGLDVRVNDIVGIHADADHRPGRHQWPRLLAGRLRRRGVRLR